MTGAPGGRTRHRAPRILRTELLYPVLEQGGRDRGAVRLTAQMGTVVAAFARLRDGKQPLAPDPKLNHATNFLYMLTGKLPDATAARWFDVALILHADHSFNASTFAARSRAATSAGGT